jgi:single-strand DNA-binding protein
VRPEGVEVNRVQLEGFTGADAELKYLPSGQLVANLSVATSERYKDSKGNDQEKTEWHRIVVFGKAAERASKIRKGQLVTLEGKLQTRSWEGKDGKKQYSTEVVAHRVHLIQLGEQQAAEPRRETAKAVEGSQEVAEDDIPF